MSKPNKSIKKIEKNTEVDTKLHKLEIDENSLTSWDNMRDPHAGDLIICYGRLITGEWFEVSYRIDYYAAWNWGATTLDRSHIYSSPIDTEIGSLLEWDDENRLEKENDPMFVTFSEELARLSHDNMTKLVINGAKNRALDTLSLAMGGYQHAELIQWYMENCPWTWVAIENNDPDLVFLSMMNENFKTTEPAEIKKIMRNAVMEAAEKLADDDSEKEELLKLYNKTEELKAT